MGSLTQAEEQLTIFYMGKVHTYQQVPTDKAKAIMLLLSGRCSSASSEGQTRTSLTSTATAGSKLDLAHSKSGSSGTIFGLSTCSSQHSKQYCALETKAQSKGSAIATPSPSSAVSISKPNYISPIKRTGPCYTGSSTKRSQAELPFARKASLARFLQKRKDRGEPKLVNVQEQGEIGGQCSAEQDVLQDLQDLGSIAKRPKLSQQLQVAS